MHSLDKPLFSEGGEAEGTAEERRRKWDLWRRRHYCTREEAREIWPDVDALDLHGLRARKGYLSRVMPLGPDRNWVLSQYDRRIAEKEEKE